MGTLLAGTKKAASQTYRRKPSNGSRRKVVFITKNMSHFHFVMACVVPAQMQTTIGKGYTRPWISGRLHQHRRAKVENEVVHPRNQSDPETANSEKIRWHGDVKARCVKGTLVASKLLLILFYCESHCIDRISKFLELQGQSWAGVGLCGCLLQVVCLCSLVTGV